MRYVVMLLLLGCLSPVWAQETSGGPGSGVPAQAPLFRSTSTDLVVLPVTVTDGDGRLVPDLGAAHFTVFDEGRRQDIAAFTSDDHPVSIALVIDTSGSMLSRVGEVIAAALAFARESHPTDELHVIGFNDVVQDALEGRTVSAADTPQLERVLRSMRPEGQTALYDALVDALDHLDGAAHARRVVVLVSDGGDNASRATLDDVLARAQRSNVTIYTIGLYDAGARDRNPGVLKRLADATGGTRDLPRSPGLLVQAVRRIALEIRRSYMIGFETTARDGRFHRLRVDVRAPGTQGLRARTRPGYIIDGQPRP